MRLPVRIRLRWNLEPLLLLTLFCFASMLSAQDHPAYQHGVLIEVNVELPCSHECGPFEPVYFNLCVQDGGQIFLARLFDTRFNYDPNKLRPLIGKAIQFRSDQRNLWIVRPDGREFQVKRDYAKSFYIDGRCVAELHRHTL
jgi:hypothetical protein